LQLPDLNTLVASTGKLATLPATVIELLEILNDSMASAAQVQKILERDPAMTANVLKISNSAFYGVRREIASVRDALVMLGNRRTATLAFTAGMAPVLRRDLLGYGISRGEFWDHALHTAAAAAEVVVRLGKDEFQCEAFTAGLIHDMGMLVLDPVLTAHKIHIMPEGPLAQVCSREKELFGFDHCQAGSLLAESWGFPEVLVVAVAGHHEPGTENRFSPVVRAVAAGDIIAETMVHELEDDERDVVEQALSDLGFDLDFLEQMREDLATRLDDICDAATSLAPVRS